MKPSVALQSHRDAIRRAVYGNDACNPRIFGSVLHGEDTDDSDLDILVDGKTQRAVVESIVVIGEAANHILRLEPSLEQTNRSLWQHCREAYDMRIALTHEYFRVDAAIAWTTVESQLPQLESILVAFLDQADRSGDGAPGQGEA